MPRGITQCYLPPGRANIPAFTPAEAGTRLSDPGRIQDWVDLVGWLHMPRWYSRPKTVTHPSTNRARRALTSFMPNAANHYATPPNVSLLDPHCQHLNNCRSIYRIIHFIIVITTASHFCCHKWHGRYRITWYGINWVLLNLIYQTMSCSESCNLSTTIPLIVS